MKKWMTNVLLVLVLLAGLSLMLYPTVADLWNSMHQSRAIATYTESVKTMDNSLYEQALVEARAYNESLLNDRLRYYPDVAAMMRYEAVLDVTGSGVMGYIEIPKIKVMLPVYHGTSDGVLQVAVGHIAGSSLPVGGESTHCILSGHRGLPSATLFTNLDQMKLGDTFMLHVLGETLTYEVDEILVVEPEEVTALQIVEGADLCTLVTCTPYGVNSHRLLVRGRRIETVVEEEKPRLNIRITGNAEQIDEKVVAICIGVPMLFILIGVLLISTRKRR